MVFCNFSAGDEMSIDTATVLDWAQADGSVVSCMFVSFDKYVLSDCDGKEKG